MCIYGIGYIHIFCFQHIHSVFEPNKEYTTTTTTTTYVREKNIFIQTSVLFWTRISSHRNNRSGTHRHISEWRPTIFLLSPWRSNTKTKIQFSWMKYSVFSYITVSSFRWATKKTKNGEHQIFLSRIVLIYREIEKKRKEKRSVLLCECVCKIHNIFCNLCVFHCECWTVCVSDLYVICILIEAKEICTSNLFSFGFGWYSVLFSVYVFDGCMCVCVCVWFILSELFISRLFREQFINKFFGLPLAHHRTLTDTHTHTHIQNEFFLFLCWFHSLISVLHMCVEMNFKLYSSSCIYMFGLFLSSPPHQSNIQSERHETIWT